MTISISRRRLKLMARLFLAILGIMAALVLDLSPRVPASAVPNAETAARARNAARTLREELRAGNGLATVQVMRADIDAAARLASWLGFARFDAAMTGGSLRLRGSRKLIGPVWFNLTAVVPPSALGLPAIALTVGDLPLGTTVSRWVIAGIRGVLRLRGVRIPPLDSLVRMVRIDRDSVTARVYFPLGSGFADDISGLRNNPIDPTLTAARYCRLMALNEASPTADMAVVVRRAFAKDSSSMPLVEQNRAAFVALAMYTVEPAAGRLAGDASRRVGKCTGTRTPPLFATRDDLPKHWALSAALAVSLGDDFGKAMGEWKELSDSRPDGSGFSFVDLAADRSGLAAARAATDPARADAVTARLRVASQEDLLPVRVLALTEGLTEDEFVQTYRTIDSAEFAAAKDRIDRVIARTVGR